MSSAGRCLCLRYAGLSSDGFFPCFTLSLTCSVSQWKPHACALLPTLKERGRERGRDRKERERITSSEDQHRKAVIPGTSRLCHAHSEEWGVYRLRSAREGRLRPDGCTKVFLRNRGLSLGLSDRGGRLFIRHFLPLVPAPGQGILGGCGTGASGGPEGRLLAKIEEDISEELHAVLGKDLCICCRLRVAELNRRRWVHCDSLVLQRDGGFSHWQRLPAAY